MSGGETSRLIALASERGEFVTGDDGFVFFWPKGCVGGFPEWALRVIADELDRRNAAWAVQMDEYFDALRDSDGSGEAGETAQTGSTEGDSAGPQGIATASDPEAAA